MTAEIAALRLPTPDRLPARRRDVQAALRQADIGASALLTLADPVARDEMRRRLAKLLDVPAGVDGIGGSPFHLASPSGPAQAEQQEHDRYFEVDRIGGDPGLGFVAGLVLAYASTYENCAAMGVTLLDDADWALLFDGLVSLIGPDIAPPVVIPPLPVPAQWRDDYDPAARWLIGHQLFFALIQGAIVGLNCFATARTDGSPAEADQGLAMAAAFMRSSAAAMKFTTDFHERDYDSTVRPAMAPPAVRSGFSGLQTRDHAYLVRLFGAVKPLLGAGGLGAAHAEFVESVVSAYAAHEFICARFRGDVLPSLRMAASSRGKTQRSGVEVIREMMRARLALIDPPSAAESPAAEPIGT